VASSSRREASDAEVGDARERDADRLDAQGRRTEIGERRDLHGGTSFVVVGFYRTGTILADSVA